MLILAEILPRRAPRLDLVCHADVVEEILRYRSGRGLHRVSPVLEAVKCTVAVGLLAKVPMKYKGGELLTSSIFVGR